MIKPNRLKILKFFLRVSAVGQLFYWSFSHLFYPQWYLNSIGIKHIQADQTGFILLLMKEIGILTWGTALATWLAARNPVREFSIIIMLIVISLGSMAVSLYQLTLKNFSGNEWPTVIILAIQLLLLVILYPWKAAISKKDDGYK